MALTTQQVWNEIDGSIFGVLGFVNPQGEPRTAGVCYVVDGRSLLISSGADSWKVRHIEQNPNVSMTVTIPKRIPFLPFIKVPAATVTFRGDAQVLRVTGLDRALIDRLFRGLEFERDVIDETRIIRVVPRGDFVTYGVAMPMLQMRKTDQARGRAPCGTDQELAPIA